jgi:ornithine carbamoyltransferase
VSLGIADLRRRHFLDIADFTADELTLLLDLADDLKKRLRSGEEVKTLAGRVLGMIFMKKSTRTRVSFEVGMYQLGGIGMFLSASELQLGHGETIRDTASTLSRYLHGVMIRAVEHADILEFAAHARIPVVNGMSNAAHPCQTMADLLTMREHFGRVAGLRVVYLGAALNVGTSLMLGCAKLGSSFTLCSPRGHEPRADAVAAAQRFAAASGGRVEVTRNPNMAVRGADVLCTDGWTPPELADEHGVRAEALAPYRLDEALLDRAGPQARILHCLPAHYGEEITEAVVYSSQSLVFEEAENRLHVQKAILSAIMS